MPDKKAEASKYWLDIAVQEILQHYPDKNQEIIVSSGISPSASYHIGHFPEIMYADALTWALRRANRKVEHLHVVDNFDPLRKRYDYLPEWLDEYAGQPICLVPDPFGDCHATYADHFYAEFEDYAKQMGIYPDRVVKSYEDLYKSGKMSDAFEDVFKNINKVHEIFGEAGRQLEKDWTPVQVLGDDKKFFNADVKDWDGKEKTVAGKSYADGQAKLNWRLDWPARWRVLKVMVEPFNRQEHGAAGSSYDTGVRFAREVFGIEPPIPGAQYGNLLLIGETKKMSSSLGNFVKPDEALQIMPPEVLRFFVVRSKAGNNMNFDPGLGLYNLVDEFSQIQEDPKHEFKEAYQFATALKVKKIRTISSVPFKHLVSVYQAALKDPDEVLKILERTGYSEQVKNQANVIKSELKFIENWLKKYAPAEVKFEVQKNVPKVDISAEQKQFLTDLAAKLAEHKQPDAQTVHETIYELKDQHKLAPSEAFKAIYRVILGKDYGPKAGWFLASLDQEWLGKRLRLES